MAVGVDPQITRELDKLRKAELIDIIICDKLPESVTSEVLSKFLKNRVNTTSNNSDSGSFYNKDIECDKKECVKRYIDVQLISNENVFLQEKVCLLGKRIDDLECIINLLNENQRKMQSDAPRLAPSKSGKAIETLKPKLTRLATKPTKESEPKSPSVVSSINSKAISDSVPEPTETSPSVSINSQQTNVDKDWQVVSHKNNASKNNGCAKIPSNNNSNIFKLGEVNHALNKVSEGIQIERNKTNSNRLSQKRTYRKAVVGANKNVTAVKSVPKLGYLHVYRLSPETTPTDLLQALKITAPHIPFKSEPLYKNDKACSMIVTFPIAYVHEVYDPEIWPEGAMVNRYKFRKSQNFPKQASQADQPRT